MPNEKCSCKSMALNSEQAIGTKIVVSLNRRGSSTENISLRRTAKVLEESFIMKRFKMFIMFDTFEPLIDAFKNLNFTS